jgi:acetyl/propionyl-CoA carboxylase alpha subunit
MLRAIADYHIIGVETTLSFGRYVLEHVGFVSGDFDTNFVKNHFFPEQLAKQNSQEATIAVQVAAFLLSQKGANSAAPVAQNISSCDGNNTSPSLWKLRSNFP